MFICLYSSTGDCDFEQESGVCTWTNDKTFQDDFDWVIGFGGTPGGSTGPSKDHTKGTEKGELKSKK